MLDPDRHDEHLTGRQVDVALAHPHSHVAVEHKKEVVSVIVGMQGVSVSVGDVGGEDCS